MCVRVVEMVRFEGQRLETGAQDSGFEISCLKFVFCTLKDNLLSTCASCERLLECLTSLHLVFSCLVSSAALRVM